MRHVDKHSRASYFPAQNARREFLSAGKQRLNSVVGPPVINLNEADEVPQDEKHLRPFIDETPLRHGGTFGVPASHRSFGTDSSNRL
jgi:hypothetical protein